MVGKIIITIDVEDWFQVENLKSRISASSWDDRELRVEKNTRLLLDILDSFRDRCSCSTDQTQDISATFFVLGWVAEKLPHLVKEISDRGHEVASHGYFHSLCTGSTHRQLAEELVKSKKFLEDLTGVRVYGFRAPSFSISDEVLDVVRKCGYLYDSSYNSFDINERYGRISLDSKKKTGIAYKIGDDFFELPVSNLELGRVILPWAGGGYFRLIPFHIFKFGVKAILKRQNAYLFYMHPWEVDPGQPRIDKLPFSFKFRHYLNLDKTAARMESFLDSFANCSFVSCKQYLDSVLLRQARSC